MHQSVKMVKQPPQLQPPRYPHRREQHVVPLSFAQQRMWFLDQFAPDSPAYNIAHAIRLSGPLHVGVLRDCLNEIVRRHETLRMTFHEIAGAPVAHVSPSLRLEVPLRDLSHMTEQDRAAEIDQFTRQQARQPFDLQRGPLLRASLVRLAEQQHLLIFVVHHSVSDRWSVGVLLKEFVALYDAFAAGHPSPLAELPIRYSDVAARQQPMLDGKKLEKQLAYWRMQLGDRPAVLELPANYPRPAVQTYRGARRALQLSSQLTAALTQLSRQQQATLFMTLSAAFNILLHRYTQQTDVVIGIPVAGRNHPETKGLIGLFVNMLPLRTDLSGNPSFRELLSRVKDAAWAAYAHQDVPFEKLVDELHVERDPGRSPLVQVVLNFHNAPLPTAGPAGLNMELLDIDTGTSKFDVTLTWRPTDDGLLALMEFNTDLFEAATIERMLGHYQRLLEAIVADPQQRIAELPLLTEAERQLMLVQWNDTQTDYPRQKTIHELFEAQVERTPDAVAVVFEDQELTYHELNAQANRLAHHLHQLGVGPEVLVAICMERSPEMIVGLLGILKAGGAYVPLDPTYPASRLAFMLQDSEAPVLLTQARLVEGLPKHAAQEVCVDRDWPMIAQGSCRNLCSGATADNLAYVIYTSGSTGRPKGVAVEHRAVNRLVINTDYVDFTPHDVVAQISNCSFDAATFEIWGALLHGARLVVISTDIVLSPWQFAAQLTQQQISAMFVTAALFNQVVREVPTAFRTVRHVLFGGEAADPRRVREVIEHGPPQRLLNAYGPTETTTFATSYLVTDVAEGAATVPIGRSISNGQVYLLDAHRQPVPIGVTGELFIAGDGLARGYLNRPELTAERFVPNPFSDKPGSRMYKTGDLARWLSDGNIEFLGRRDHQVKLRGFRIELGEIEVVLRRHRQVQEAVVVVGQGAGNEKCLVAYVVPQQDQVLEINDIRKFLQRTLPNFMVPSTLVVLSNLPLTPNGKLDRAALPHPDRERSALSGGYLSPRTPIEKTLTQIWADVLGLERVGIDDNFFELGGHSLLAVRMFAQIEKRLGRRLSLTTLFQDATIEQLARNLQQPNPKSAAAIVKIQPSAAGLCRNQRVKSRSDNMRATRDCVSTVDSKGTKQPLFFLYSMGGEVLYCRRLAGHLGLDQPVYGIEQPRIDGVVEHMGDIEAMAARCVEHLCAFQSEGPYHLAGFSFAGMLAFEVARQLDAKGDQVGLVAIIDTGPSRRMKKSAADSLLFVPHFLRNLPYWLIDDLLQTKPSVMLTRIRRKIKAVAKRSGESFTSSSLSSSGPDLEELYDVDQMPDHRRETLKSNLEAFNKYVPKPFPGRVTLLRARTRPLFRPQGSDLGWGHLAAGGVTVKTIPGHHVSIMKQPLDRILAEQLQAALDEVK